MKVNPSSRGVFKLLRFGSVFILAFLICFLLTPLARKIAYVVGAVDIPKDKRKIHKKPMPRLGGLAIYFGVIACLLVYIKLDRELIGIILASSFIVIAGILDDIFELRAIYKLAAQLIAAIIFVVFGNTIDWMSNPFGEMFKLGILGIPLTILWVVGITNAVNLIDGLDGLAAGVATISSVTLFIVSILNQRYEAAVITIAIAGACLGFLPFNFNPAKIFMGDTGSMFLGFMLSAISVYSTIKSATALAVAVPILAIGLPIFDTFFAIIRRLINKKPIMKPDKGHIHHRLLDKGLTQRQAVLVMYGISILFGFSAILISDSNLLKGTIVLGMTLFIAYSGARLIGIIDFGEHKKLDA